MKSYKQLITGIVIGATAATAVAFAGDLRTFVATEADFPVMVNGSPVTLDMPVVTIQDRTYLPLRAMGDILGVSVDWDGSQAVVTTDATPEPTATPMPESTTTSNTPIPTTAPYASITDTIAPIVTTDKDPNRWQRTSNTKDGLPIWSYQGIDYVIETDIEHKLKYIGFGQYEIVDTTLYDWDDKTGASIIDNIPVHHNDNGSVSIPLDFYYSTILPWIENLTK